MRRLERRGVEVIAHTSIKYVGRPMEWELAGLAGVDKLGGNDKEQLPVKVRDPKSHPISHWQCYIQGHISTRMLYVWLRDCVNDGMTQIYLTSKVDSLDTSAILTDHVVVVGSSPVGTVCPIQFQGQGLEVDDKTGGTSIHSQFSQLSMASAYCFGVFPSPRSAVMVNHELMASSSVYVAGDAAYFPCRALGRMAVRSVDHSYHSGHVAGQ